jgi:hypothetical protein
MAEYRAIGVKAYPKAVNAVRDEVDAELVHSSKAIIDRKKVTFKELRYAVDLLESLAERG